MRGRAVILAAALVWLICIERAEAKLDILVDKATQRMLVIQDGYLRYIWPVSTGRDTMATPSGVYRPQRLERNWFSTAYYDSPMPYSIFFHNGYAIHGSYAIDRLGGPASHGCVRLHPHHAAVLFDLVQLEGPDKTTIEVSDEGRRPEEASLPVREIAAGPGLNPQMPRTVRYRDPGDLPDLSAAQRGSRLMGARNPSPPMPVPMMDGGRAEEPPLPLREIAEGPGGSPPVPRKVNYREAGDMPALPLSQRGNRLIAARNSLAPRPPASRYMLTDVKPPLTDVRPPASVPRAPSGAREVDMANRAQRASNEPFDSRSKPKVAEASPPEKTQQAPSVQPQQSASSFRLLPASCWSGGASRWRWWASSEGPPCK
jgi:L,D-transpeptidase catalytic domain